MEAGVEAATVTREAVIGMVIGQVAVTAAEAQVGMGKKDVQKIVIGTVAAMVLVVTGMAVAVVEAPHGMKGGPKIALVLMIVQVVAAGRPMIEGGMIMHLETACLSSCWFL
jgi:ABC-type transport system involved in cytochrome bd biosynthesis fused ATPase/permease subunit